MIKVVSELVSKIIGPLFGLIDDMHTSEEERMKARESLLRAQSELTGKLLEYEAKLTDARASIIKAEAKGESWLQRNWRPLLMLTATIIIANNYIVVPLTGTPPMELPDTLWTLLQYGVTGYIVARSAEKIAPNFGKKND